MAVKKVLERDIKKYLKDEVKKRGGLARKVRYENINSAPDWLIILNSIMLVELKKPGEVPTKAQQREIDRINDHGGNATYVNSFEGIDKLLHSMRPQIIPMVLRSPNTR